MAEALACPACPKPTPLDSEKRKRSTFYTMEEGQKKLLVRIHFPLCEICNTLWGLSRWEKQRIEFKVATEHAKRMARA